MLDTDIKKEIANFVRTGFYDAEEIVEILTEEMYDPEEVDPDEVLSQVEKEFEKLEQEKSTWSAVTDCDRLENVFISLRAQGILASHNAGTTQSDGYDDFIQEYDESPDKSSISGYCFYHGQDLERVTETGILNLAFGPVDANEEATKGIAVGDIVKAELEKAGFTVQWDGTFDQRISIPGFVWQKR